MNNNINNPLLLVIIILVILFLAEKTLYYYKDKQNILINYNKKEKSNNKLIETFEEGKIFSTLITKLDPIEGDSSTIVTVDGKNLNLIGKVLFNNVECAILDNREDNRIQIIPPSLSEIGTNITEIRKRIKETKQGYRVNIKITRRDVNTLQNKGNSPEDDINIVEVPGLYFSYIDRLPYLNVCPQPEPPIPTQEFELDEEIEYPKDSDLEFLNKILPEREEKINKLILKLNKIIEENKNKYENDSDTSYLEILQALDSLEKKKIQMNNHRYDIQNTLNKKYDNYFYNADKYSGIKN